MLDPDAEWTSSELEKTLKVFGEDDRLAIRLCIFIDGLDECDEDHYPFAKYLIELCQHPGVKLCVSSRRWSAFRSAFKNHVDGTILMEELTKADIVTYVSANLCGLPDFQQLQREDPEGCKHLISAIVALAEGVFLWVYLVVTDLRRDICNIDSLKMLWNRVKEYPTDLEKYFLRMFERIDKKYNKHSARIFLMMMSSKTRALSRTDPYYVEWEIDNPNYSVEMPIGRGEPWLEKIDQESTARYMDARCADLVSIDTGALEFIHHTAKEFVAQESVRRVLISRAGDDFDASLSYARSWLCCYKTQWTLGPDALRGSMLIWTALGDEVKPELRHKFYEILEHFDENGEVFYRLFKAMDEEPEEKYDSEEYEGCCIAGLISRALYCWYHGVPAPG
jgi:hypothetical protein